MSVAAIGLAAVGVVLALGPIRAAAEGGPPPSPAHPLDGHPLDGHPLDAHPLDGHPLDAHPLDAHPLDGDPLDGHPLDGHPLDGRVLRGDAPAGRIALLFDPADPAPRPPRSGPAAPTAPVAADATARRAAPASRAPAPARLDQVWLSFVPKIQVLRPGDTLLLRDRDDEAHTVHAWFDRHTLFDVAATPAGKEQRVTLPRPGVVTLTCDLHPAMRAYLVVSGAAASAVTDLDGRFHLPPLPPGRYRVRAFRPGEDAAVAGVEPGTVVAALDLPTVPRGAPLLLRLGAAPASPAATAALGDETPSGEGARPAPVAPVAPVAANRVARPPPPRPLVLPRWLLRLGSGPAWPTGGWIYLASVLALVAGFALAIANLRLAARRGGSRGGAVLIGAGLSFLAGLSILSGLHPAVATALGFAIFIGTAIFAADG